MANNAYLSNVRETKEKAYREGVMAGMHMGFNITAIKLNHLFGFGDGRLTKLEAGVQGFVNAIVDLNDPLVTQVRIERELKRIRGDKFFTEE